MPVLRNPDFATSNEASDAGFGPDPFPDRAGQPATGPPSPRDRSSTGTAGQLDEAELLSAGREFVFNWLVEACASYEKAAEVRERRLEALGTSRRWPC